MSEILTEKDKELIRNQKEEELAEQRKKSAEFRKLQKLPYGRKVNIAFTRALEFHKTITEDYNASVHVSVGGLDSITLYLFIKKYISPEIKGVSVSVIEDKSIQLIHKELGIIPLKPLKSKAAVIKEYGFPIISKEKAGKIEKLQNPTEKNATVRHAIMTGETGAQGGYRKGTSMKLPQKWLDLFAGMENDKYGVNYRQADFKVSNKCCGYLKEKPCNNWAKQNNSHPYIGLMASEGGQREKALMKYGCNYYGKSTIRSCPFAIFTRQDLLKLALELKVPVPEIYGGIEASTDGALYTPRAQRTGCSMCGFGIHLDKRPHHFDRLREANPKEWGFWMYEIGWGKALSYIGVGWEDVVCSE